MMLEQVSLLGRKAIKNHSQLLLLSGQSTLRKMKAAPSESSGLSLKQEHTLAEAKRRSLDHLTSSKLKIDSLSLRLDDSLTRRNQLTYSTL